MRYAAPWDRALRISTSVVLVVLAITAAVLLRLAATAGTPPGIAWGVVAVLALVVALSWALAPRGFSVVGNGIEIERPLRPVRIPLSEVRGVGVVSEGAFHGAVRLLGSSGFFGTYGRFWSRRLGTFRAYATRSRDLVRIDTARERFLLSPDPADRFVEEVLGRAPGASRAEPAEAVERRPISRRAWLAMAVPVALVPIAIAAVLVGTWAYSPRAARVEGGAVVIERERARPVVIPLAGVRAAEVLRGGRLGRLERVSGFSGRSAAFGRYRSDTLGEVELYAWRRRGPFVLLETTRGRIVLTPDAPDAFVAAVRAGIASR